MKYRMFITTVLAGLVSHLYAEDTGTMMPTPSTPNQVQTAPIQPTAPVTINCHYRIPTQINQIDNATIKTWSQKAVLQSFDMSYSQMDLQLNELKHCFTEQGWQSFSDAFTKSGNMDAIRSQQLTMTGMVDGEINVTENKENQWRVNIPLQVVYQNAQEKITQELNVDILVGRKASGDLGIMQMIATPKNTNTSSGPSDAPQTTSYNTNP